MFFSNHSNLFLYFTTKNYSDSLEFSKNSHQTVQTLNILKFVVSNYQTWKKIKFYNKVVNFSKIRENHCTKFEQILRFFSIISIN
jgi:hypothetical protein